MELITERLESLKAGTISSLSLGVIFIITTLVNSLLLSKYWSILTYPSTTIVNLPIVLSGVIAGFSGFLFGVTYRYIIRNDTNPHLRTGAVWAFGLIRGLTQIELGWNNSEVILPYLIMAGESILWFAFAGFILNLAILHGWLKSFS
ncbi:hypothetical protein H6F32_08010 [Anabaena sp. FACHB-1237]|uniref:hypothetical protein n=1 Tax=Anabaena sp. FACHB-1237 TaxID=2692769 RepID=UPI001680F04B|nr:hypothetical protein [Anabaena sp. FACHB-1237]MBD2137528.1 hypothetical protein [Anabaena sp. FACHB-1237]